MQVGRMIIPIYYLATVEPSPFVSSGSRSQPSTSGGGLFGQELASSRTPSQRVSTSKRFSPTLHIARLFKLI